MIRQKQANRRKVGKQRSGCSSVECCDSFSSTMGFGLGDGIYTYSTGWGCCLTVLSFLLTCLYATEKLVVQELLSSYSVTKHYDPGQIMTLDRGFNIAFAITAYEGPSIGVPTTHPQNYTIEAVLDNWAPQPNSKETLFKSYKLRTHLCTHEELGLGRRL